MTKPLLLIKVSKRFLHLLTRFLHVSAVTSVHSSFAKDAIPLTLDGFPAITRFFNSLHRFSIRFKSWLWLGRSHTLTSLFRNQILANLEVCFGSLCYLRRHCIPSRNLSALYLIFCSKILMYCSFSLMSSTFTRFPFPLTEKNYQSITVVTVFLGLNASPFLCQTKATSLCPKSSIFVSSYLKTDNQNLDLSLSANARQACACLSFRSGIFLALHPRKPPLVQRSMECLP